MRALVADPSGRGGTLAEVSEPVRRPRASVVEVHHASLNYGDPQRRPLWPRARQGGACSDVASSCCRAR